MYEKNTTDPAAYTVRTLENTDHEILRQTLNLAFSDYELPLQFSRESLENLLRIRRFDSKLSAGAFLPDGRLIGMVMNGADIYNGVRTLYDTGTGVVPEYRGRGITASLLAAVETAAAEQGYGRYVLEVLCGNKAALRTYQGQGFTVLRRLICLSAEPVNQVPGGFTVAVEDRPLPGVLKEAAKFLNAPPTWQNSLRAIELTNDASIFTIRARRRLTACGVVQNSGNIMLLAVRPECRRQGMMTALLSAMSRRNGKMSILNVDGGDQETLAALKKRGFQVFAEQYEMERKIKETADGLR